MAIYRLIKRWYISDGDPETAEQGWKTLAVFRKARKAKKAMHKDIRAVEEYNCYQDPGYGGKEDTQNSSRINPLNHVYDMADCNGSYVEWEIVRGQNGFSNLFPANL